MMPFYHWKKIIRITFASVFLVCLCLQVSGCASDSYAAKGAKQGAAQGAISGAVGGLVSALVFGGDPVDRAARGAVYGGAIGATAGGISGSSKDKQVKAQQQAQAQEKHNEELGALRVEIGEDAFKGLASLAECKHDITLDRADKAQQSANPNYRLAGLWLEVLSYADLGKKRRVRKMLPVLVAEDWDINNEAEADTVIRQGVADLAVIRSDFNLPVVCK